MRLEAVVLDTETTGAVEPEPVEIAWVEIDLISADYTNRAACVAARSLHDSMSLMTEQVLVYVKTRLAHTATNSVQSRKQPGEAAETLTPGLTGEPNWEAQPAGTNPNIKLRGAP